MTSTNWTMSDDQLLAEYVPLEEFKGILQRRIGISPDHAALLIRDGRLVDTFQGAHFSVGGIWQSIKQALGGEHAVRLLVADMKPFPIEGGIEGISRDRVPVTATVTVELQLNPEKPQNILGLMQERGTLARQDVYQRLLPHLKDRVFASVLNQVDATELRGNTALQDKIQADMMQEAERLFGDLGLLVRAVSMNWGLNEEERIAMDRRNREREQENLDQEFARKKRELERENQAKEFVLRSDLTTEKLKAAGEDELKRLLLHQELGFIDARDAGVRTQQFKKLAHEIDVLNVERQAGYAKALEDSRNAVEQSQIRRQLTQVELEIQDMQTLQRLKLERLEEEQKLDIAGRARQQQLDAMRGLNDVELDGEERRRRIDRDDRLADHGMGMDGRRLDAETELEKLKAQAGMSPEQILAINAGLSPDVAKVFAERARADALGADKQQVLLREMVETSRNDRAASDEQARYFFDKAMKGVADVSANVGGRPAEPRDETLECPNCRRRIPASDRFCRFCGKPTRA